MNPGSLKPATDVRLDEIIPQPVSVLPAAGVFTLSPATDIGVEPATAELIGIGQHLAARLAPATGCPLPVAPASGLPGSGHIHLTTTADAGLGEEGYRLEVSPAGVVLAAHRPAGLFRGVQTILQLLPPAIRAATVQPGPWEMPCGVVSDHPRFPWRGAMLDVSRHFFGVGDVKRVLDLLAYYKMNYFHLHLTDDQGWRIAIQSWPRLTEYGGSTQVGGGRGGYYTQAEYAEIVAHAQARYITVVPEIDMPGHTHAALASYAELNRDGQAPPLYTGTRVGFSSLCAEKEITYTFLDDVVHEIASLTPGPYIHVGGDEAAATPPDDYVRLVRRANEIVRAHGKRMIGWEEIARAGVLPDVIAQHWHENLAALAVAQGAKVIMSPGSRTYLDMQYDPTTPLGLHWAGYVSVERAYAWEPAMQVAGVSEADIVGVEAPLWSETLQTLADIEFMLFPRLPGIAEVGWSPAASRNWEAYRERLAAHGPRLAALGVNFYPAPEVPWR